MLLALAVALAMTAATPAIAGPIAFTPSIEGAGSIAAEQSDPPYECSGDDSSLNSDTTDCPLGMSGLEAETVRLVATPSATAPGQWEFVRWEGCSPPEDSEHVCLLEALDPLPATFTPKAVFRDDTAPTVTVTESRAPGDASTVEFAFAADEPAEFQCGLDAEPLAPCSSPITYPRLAAGQHVFTVRGTDVNDNGEQIALTFTVDGPPGTDPPRDDRPLPVQPPAIQLPTIPLLARVLGPNALRAKVSRKRRLSLRPVRLTCPAVATPCRASVVLRGRLGKRRKPVVLARQSLAVRPSSSARPKLRLKRRAAKVLARKRRMRAVASIAIAAPNATTSKDVRVALRTAAPKKKQKKRRARR